MKNKVLIKVYVAFLDEDYEIFIPTNESIGKVVQLIIKSIYDLSDGIINNDNHVLFDPETSVVYEFNKLVRDSNLSNGKKVVLI